MAVLKTIITTSNTRPRVKAGISIKPKDFFDSYGGFKGFVAILEKILDTEVADALDATEMDELQRFMRSVSNGRFDRAIHKIANNLN